MLVAGSALKGYGIEALDGRIGSVRNFLFDDTTWKLRWLVVDTGHWLSGRQVLVHPSAIGLPDHAAQRLPVVLSKAQIEASPDIQQDRPVSLQMQNNLYSYYGWDPYWGPNQFGSGVSDLGLFGAFTPSVPMSNRVEMAAAERVQFGSDDGDPHLRSMTDVVGYNMHATDGAIGHLENVLIDDVSWTIHYLIVDTRNWWPGAHVLMSPYAVHDIDWSDREINLNVTRERVRASPKWDPAEIVEHLYQRELHHYYGWPGYGW